MNTAHLSEKMLQGLGGFHEKTQSHINKRIIRKTFTSVNV